MRVLSLPCRFCRRMLCKMVRLVNNRFSFEWFRQTLSSSWTYIVKVCLGLFPLLAIRYWLKDRGSRSEPGEVEENETPPNSLSLEEENPESKGLQLPETDPNPAHEPVRKWSRDEDEEELESTEWRVDSTDELYCEYDSTWDTEDSLDQDQDQNQEEDTGYKFSRRFRKQSYKFGRFKAAARDLQNYRHDYPHMSLRWKSQDTDGYPNLEFYLGNSPSLPDNVYINEFHTQWYGNYAALESVHSYIQWLFPLQEPGVNPQASTLTKEEIEEFCQNNTARNNLLESYKLMLDFYGIELCDEETGEVKRASNWRERFNNMNNRTHNNLRITRILKCLATLGFPHYQTPLVRFFLEETLVNGELPNVKDSVLNYFLFAVRDKKQRRRLLKFAYLKYDKKEEFVWCPKKIQLKWSGLLASNSSKKPEVSQSSLMSCTSSAEVENQCESAEAGLNDHYKET